MLSTKHTMIIQLDWNLYLVNAYIFWFFVKFGGKFFISLFPS